MDGSGSSKRRRLSDTPRWTKRHTDNLKGVLFYDVRPTRRADIPTLTNLGVREDVEEFFTTLGMRKIIGLTGPIYPELVREFLASCELTFRNQSTRARDGILSFFLKRKFYSVSISELCDVYEFPNHTETELGRIPQEREFWNTIATGNPEVARITYIRNPALRIIATILGQTLFFKRRNPEMESEELTLLYHGTKHLTPQVAGPIEFNVNLGGFLARRLTEWRDVAGLGYRNTHCGTILTPLFQYLGLDLRREEREDKDKTADIGFLIRSGVLLENHEYRFSDKDGQEWRIDLPYPRATSLTSERNLTFLPPLED